MLAWQILRYKVSDLKSGSSFSLVKTSKKLDICWLCACSLLAAIKFVNFRHDISCSVCSKESQPTGLLHTAPQIAMHCKIRMNARPHQRTYVHQLLYTQRARGNSLQSCPRSGRANNRIQILISGEKLDKSYIEARSNKPVSRLYPAWKSRKKKLCGVTCRPKRN